MERGRRQARCGQVRWERCAEAARCSPHSIRWDPVLAGGQGSGSIPPRHLPGRWEPHLRPRGAVIYGDSPQSTPFTWPLVTGAGHEAEGLAGLQEGKGGAGGPGSPASPARAHFLPALV